MRFHINPCRQVLAWYRSIKIGSQSFFAANKKFLGAKIYIEKENSEITITKNNLISSLNIRDFLKDKSNQH